jgi:hypothetical protein
MKRNMVAACIVAAGIIAMLAVLTTLPESPVSKATYERIEKGMTMDEVQAIVGMPPTDDLDARSSHRTTTFAWWTNPDGSGFHVIIDERDGVCDKTWIDSTETIGEKLKRWVRWTRWPW